MVIVDDDRKVEDLKDLEQAFFAWQVCVAMCYYLCLCST